MRRRAARAGIRSISPKRRGSSSGPRCRRRGETRHAHARHLRSAHRSNSPSSMRLAVGAVDAEAAGHAEMHHQHSPSSSRRAGIWRAGRAPRPCARQAARRNASGNGKRRSVRRCSTRAKRRPTRTGSRPRRTVSTSGSSGMSAVTAMRNDLQLHCNNSLISGLALLSARMADTAKKPRAAAAERELSASRAVAPESQAGPGQRGLCQGRPPLRPDERSDVGRPAPAVEGRSRRLARARRKVPAPSRCSTSPAAPATSPSASSRPRAAAPRAVICDIIAEMIEAGRAAGGDGEAAARLRARQCRGAAVPTGASMPIRSPSASAT